MGLSWCLFVLLVAVAAAPWAEGARDLSASSAHTPRVRKELRSLTSAEHKLFVMGVSTMLSTQTKDGQRLFGPKYKEYQYFIIKHAVCVNDPRGDQGHLSQAFMTFHRSLLLEFEESLLSIVPGLKALPYWDMLMDLVGGRYYKTSKTVFGPAYGGSLDAAASNDYQVADSTFGWRQVNSFQSAKWGKYGHIYSGSLTTGLLRSATNDNPNLCVTRYPAANIKLLNAEVFLGSYTPNASWWLDNMAKGTDMKYTQADFKRCHDASSYTSWNEWNWCIDFGNFPSVTTPTTAFLEKYTTNASPLLHAGAHWIIGGVSENLTQGDMFDVTTSPNEPWLFMTHHANVDRSLMIWQRNALARDPRMGDAGVMWEYPATYAAYPYSPNGTYLHDVVTAAFGFTDIFAKPPQNATGYSHFEVLDYTRPCSTPYTYDRMDV